MNHPFSSKNRPTGFNQIPSLTFLTSLHKSSTISSFNNGTVYISDLPPIPRNESSFAVDQVRSEHDPSPKSDSKPRNTLQHPQIPTAPNLNHPKSSPKHRPSANSPCHSIESSSSPQTSESPHSSTLSSPISSPMSIPIQPLSVNTATSASDPHTKALFPGANLFISTPHLVDHQSTQIHAQSPSDLQLPPAAATPGSEQSTVTITSLNINHNNHNNQTDAKNDQPNGSTQLQITNPSTQPSQSTHSIPLRNQYSMQLLQLMAQQSGAILQQTNNQNNSSNTNTASNMMQFYYQHQPSSLLNQQASLINTAPALSNFNSIQPNNFIPQLSAQHSIQTGQQQQLQPQQLQSNIFPTNFVYRSSNNFEPSSNNNQNSNFNSSNSSNIANANIVDLRSQPQQQQQQHMQMQTIGNINGLYSTAPQLLPTIPSSTLPHAIGGHNDDDQTTRAIKRQRINTNTTQATSFHDDHTSPLPSQPIQSNGQSAYMQISSRNPNISSSTFIPSFPNLIFSAAKTGNNTNHTHNATFGFDQGNSLEQSQIESNLANTGLPSSSANSPPTSPTNYLSSTHSTPQLAAIDDDETGTPHFSNPLNNINHHSILNNRNTYSESTTITSTPLPRRSDGESAQPIHSHASRTSFSSKAIYPTAATAPTNTFSTTAPAPHALSSISTLYQPFSAANNTSPFPFSPFYKNQIDFGPTDQELLHQMGLSNTNPTTLSKRDRNKLSAYKYRQKRKQQKQQVEVCLHQCEQFLVHFQQNFLTSLNQHVDTFYNAALQSNRNVMMMAGKSNIHGPTEAQLQKIQSDVVQEVLGMFSPTIQQMVLFDPVSRQFQLIPDWTYIVQTNEQEQEQDYDQDAVQIDGGENDAISNNHSANHGNDNDAVKDNADMTQIPDKHPSRHQNQTSLLQYQSASAINSSALSSTSAQLSSNLRNPNMGMTKSKSGVFPITSPLFTQFDPSIQSNSSSILTQPRKSVHGEEHGGFLHSRFSQQNSYNNSNGNTANGTNGGSSFDSLPSHLTSSSPSITTTSQVDQSTRTPTKAEKHSKASIFTDHPTTSSNSVHNSNRSALSTRARQSRSSHLNSSTAPSTTSQQISSGQNSSESNSRRRSVRNSSEKDVFEFTVQEPYAPYPISGAGRGRKKRNLVASTSDGGKNSVICDQSVSADHQQASAELIHGPDQVNQQFNTQPLRQNQQPQPIIITNAGKSTKSDTHRETHTVLPYL